MLFEASADPRFAGALLELVERRRRVRGQRGELIATAVPAWRGLRGDRESPCEPRALKAEQSNSSIVYGDRLILKLFRMLDPGVNPDLEIGRMLDAHAHFAHTPPLAGWLEYQTGRDEPRTVGVLHGFIPNQGDAWTHVQAELSQYFERALTHKDRTPELPAKPLVNLVAEDQPGPMVTEAIGAFLETARAAWGGAPPSCISRWPRPPTIPTSPRNLTRRSISARSTSRCAIWRARFFACCVRACPCYRRCERAKASALLSSQDRSLPRASRNICGTDSPSRASAPTAIYISARCCTPARTSP